MLTAVRAQASAVDLRLAVPGDAAVLAAIHAASFARGWNEESMAQFISVPGCLVLLASRGQSGPVEGFLIARKAEDEAEILTLAVHPDCRRAGLARALVETGISRMRAAGAARLFLEVDEANAPACALYRSFGAEQVGRRCRYYEHGADAVIFSLALSPATADDG
jgi:[ribosomal protein S18]-alanine N-acetyltransferase